MMLCFKNKTKKGIDLEVFLNVALLSCTKTVWLLFFVF